MTVDARGRSHLPQGAPASKGGEYAVEQRSAAADPDAVLSAPAHQALTESEADERYGAWAQGRDGNVLTRDEAERYPKRYQWTLIDGEDGRQCMVPGIHHVNTYGYVATERPWEHEDIEVRLDSSDDDPEVFVENHRMDMNAATYELSQLERPGCVTVTANGDFDVDGTFQVDAPVPGNEGVLVMGMVGNDTDGSEETFIETYERVTERTSDWTSVPGEHRAQHPDVLEALESEYGVDVAEIEFTPGDEPNSLDAWQCAVAVTDRTHGGFVAMNDDDEDPQSAITVGVTMMHPDGEPVTIGRRIPCEDWHPDEAPDGSAAAYVATFDNAVADAIATGRANGCTPLPS